jgi:hypothetical protein
MLSVVPEIVGVEGVDTALGVEFTIAAEEDEAVPVPTGFIAATVYVYEYPLFAGIVTVAVVPLIVGV